MKKAAVSLFHILMALIVLVSGTSFTVKKMVCLSSGNVETGFYSLDGCCGDEEQASDAQLTESCCKYSSETFYLDQKAPVKEFSLKKTDIIYLPAILPLAPELPVISYKSSIPYVGLPPPLSGRERLTLIRILVI
jgi:hypothetical protein